MAFTKIVSPGIDTTGSYTVRDLNAVGVVTASAFSGPLTGNATGLTGTPDIAVANITATGNVSIGGTLTYEDVTNIDSVGIITARDGIIVTGGRVLIGTTTEGESGADDLTIATSSTTGITIRSGTSNAGNIYFSDGTSGAAEYRGYISYMHNEDSFAIGTDGNEKVRITSGGVVGINTNASNNPSGSKLVVGGRIQSNAGGYWFAGANGAEDGWHVQDSGGNLLVVESGVAERLRITSAGKIGINTASPRAVLDIEGNAENFTLFLHSNDANANLQFSDNTGGARILNYGGDLAFRTGTNAHAFGTGDNEALRISSAGLVGIGTDNPALRAHIYSTAATDAALIESTQNFATLRFKSAVNSSGPTIGIDGGGGLQFDQKDTSKYISFAIGSNGEKLRITSDGYLGINHTSPGTRLVVKQNNGVAYNGNAQSVSYNAAAFINANGHTNGGTYTGFQFNITGDSQNRICSMGMISESSSNRNSSLVFHTDDNNNRSEKLRITSAGKIGINQSSPFAELDITSTTETTTGTLSQHGIRLSAPGAADGEVIPITGGFLSNQDRARAGIGFISRVAGSSVGYAGAIGFYTRSSADGNGLLRTDEKVRINESGTLIVDAGGEAQDIQIISHSAGGGHGKIYLRGNASNESSSIQLNHFGHADYHISSGRAGNGLFSITRTNGNADGIVMNANGNVGIQNTGTSSKLHIGDLVSSVSSDINTTHTSLIIKQTNNDNKSGLYIERSGERKGYYMWMNPGGGAGDGLTFTRNNNGTKSDALILDRDANLTAGGHIYPSSNNTYDLGSTANAWRNVYTNDLHLSNMSGGGNDVDGTTGDWTIQEGEENLYIINNRSGKKYKFNLQEVN